MEIHIAAAKIPKFGYGESGDRVEVVERPRGGLTAVLADGQGHGRAAKRTSNMVVTKAVALVGDGARDGAVARAVHDYLYTHKDGKVSTDLTLISVDLRTRTLVVSRNSTTPVLLRQGFQGVQRLDERVEPIGFHHNMRPAITEAPLLPHSIAVAMSDGVLHAGAVSGNPMDLAVLVAMVEGAEPERVDHLAGDILECALAYDQRRPGDDMTVLAVGIGAHERQELVRRLTVMVPL